jgi:hypothetical protein
MQDKIRVYWLLINPLKMWQSSSIWGHQQIKIAFTKELRAYLNVRNVCYHSVLPTSSLNT